MALRLQHGLNVRVWHAEHLFDNEHTLNPSCVLPCLRERLRHQLDAPSLAQAGLHRDNPPCSRIPALSGIHEVPRRPKGAAPISDDDIFTEHVQALAEVLRVETTSKRALPEQAAALLADLSRLDLAIDQATGAAEDAEMLGTASPLQ